MNYEDTGDPKYPYKLLADYSHELLPCMNGAVGKVCGKDGNLYVKLANGQIKMFKDYRWDGLDWSPDFSCAMKASLVHDALYQWIDACKTRERFRKCADQHFYCIAKNSCGIRLASTMYYAIRGYQKAWLVGGALGAIWGFFSRPRVSCF